MNIEDIKISKVEVEGALPKGCPSCIFDKLTSAQEPCAVSGCLKSSYGYRPDGCKLVSVAEPTKET